MLEEVADPPCFTCSPGTTKCIYLLDRRVAISWLSSASGAALVFQTIVTVKLDIILLVVGYLVRVSFCFLTCFIVLVLINVASKQQHPRSPQSAKVILLKPKLREHLRVVRTKVRSTHDHVPLQHAPPPPRGQSNVHTLPNPSRS
jgi:hypothetical protein